MCRDILLQGMCQKKDMVVEMMAKLVVRIFLLALVMVFVMHREKDVPWGGSRVRKPDARIGTNSRREGRPCCRSCVGGCVGIRRKTGESK